MWVLSLFSLIALALAQQPNFIVILTDDQGKHRGCAMSSLLPGIRPSLVCQMPVTVSACCMEVSRRRPKPAWLERRLEFIATNCAYATVLAPWNTPWKPWTSACACCSHVRPCMHSSLDMACYIHSHHTADYMMGSSSRQFMPNLHALIGDQGLELRNFVVSMAWCCPSRVSLQTGRHVHNTNITSAQLPRGVCAWGGHLSACVHLTCSVLHTSSYICRNLLCPTQWLLLLSSLKQNCQSLVVSLLKHHMCHCFTLSLCHSVPSQVVLIVSWMTGFIRTHWQCGCRCGAA